MYLWDWYDQMTENIYFRIQMSINSKLRKCAFQTEFQHGRHTIAPYANVNAWRKCVECFWKSAHTILRSLMGS